MTLPVLIVGAGPSGLILALSLLRNDVPVRIIEKKAAHSIGQKGAGVQPRTLELFKFLGILPEMLKLSSGLAKMEQWSAPQGPEPIGVTELMTRMEDTPSKPYHNPVMVGQDLQEGIIRSVLKKEYGVFVELGSELQSFEQHADYVIASIAKSRKDGDVVEQAKVSYLVGCDGAHSMVRKKLGLTFLGDTPNAQTMLLGDIHVKGLDNSHMYMWGGFGGKCAALRPYTTETVDDRFFFLMGGPGIDSEKIMKSREEFTKTFQEITGRTDIEFGEVIAQGQWRPNMRMVNKFGEGRVFVAGDSAHVHSPTGGQGLNSGIQDSINLAWKMSLVLKNLSPPSILDTYSQERLPIIASMLNITTEIYNNSAARGFIRGADWGYELRQFGVNYRGSPLVVDEIHDDGIEAASIDHYRAGEDGFVRAGDRAPESPDLVPVVEAASSGQTTAATRFFDIFRPQKHTVLVFLGSGRNDLEELIQTLSEYPTGTIQTVLVYPQTTNRSSSTSIPSGADSVLVDHSGYAYKHYVIDEDKGGVVIVRPDGWIGGLLNDVAGVKKYFGKIFVL